MIGPRIGPRIGPKIGPGFGASADEIGGVGPDCTCPFAGTGYFADVFRPLAANQFPCVNATIPEPDYFFEFQEASGNLVCSVTGATLVQTGAGTYANTVENAPTASDDYTIAGGNLWLGTSEVASQRWDTGTGNLFNVNTQSIFCLSVHALTGSGGSRPLWILGGNQLFVRTNVSGFIEVVRGASTATGAVDVVHATLTPFGLAVIWDIRGAGLVRAAVRGSGSIGAGETITPTWASVADNVKGLGFSGTAPPAGRHNFWAVWVGSKAETLADRGGAGNGASQILIDMGL